MRINRRASEADFATLERAVAPDASQNDAAASDAFVDRIERLCLVAGVPRRLSELGVTSDQLDWLAENSGGTSMRGNPVQLPAAELRSLLAAMF